MVADRKKYKVYFTHLNGGFSLALSLIRQGMANFSALDEYGDPIFYFIFL